MRERVSGLLVLLLICASIAHGADARFPQLIAGTLVWAAALMLWHRVRGVQRLQTLAMLVLGSAGLAWAYWRHEALPWRQVFVANEALIAMVSAVTFLRLIAQPASGPNEALPRGRGAMLRTLFGVHLFGSVINYSSVPIFGDRIARNGRLARAQIITLSRGFSSASQWSPFFAAMGVALLNAPGALLFTVMALGLPLAMIALLFTAAVLTREPDIDSFRGYPMHFGALKLPGALAAAVLLVNLFSPQTPILSVISLFSLLLTGIVLFRRSRRTLVRRFMDHAQTALPNTANEIVLFVAAGLFATGISAVAQTTGITLGTDRVDAETLSLLLVAMVGVSLLGAHPVISISVVGGLVAATVSNPHLLAMSFLMAWALGVAISPVSVMNLGFQGRYGISSFRFIGLNGRYVLVMLAVDVAALYVGEWLLGW
jgi:hypothetical protein